MLQNKLLTLGVGIVLTFLVYCAIASFGGREDGNRRKVVVAGIASFVAACAMAGLLILAEDAYAREQGGIPLTRPRKGW